MEEKESVFMVSTYLVSDCFKFYCKKPIILTDWNLWFQKMVEREAVFQV